MVRHLEIFSESRLLQRGLAALAEGEQTFNELSLQASNQWIQTTFILQSFVWYIQCDT